MSDESQPLSFGDVTLRIERLRGEAGRDAARLATLALELERHLAEAAPDKPLLAVYAREVLEGYVLLARYGLFPEVRTGDEDL